MQQGLSALITNALTPLERNWPSGLPGGVIHADLFPDNVLFMDGNVSGLIDFYFACNDAYAYDLAVMLNAWCFERDGSYNLTNGSAMIAAYRRERELSAEERDALPILARGAALRFLLTRLYDWLNPDPPAIVRPKDPREFAKRLRFYATATKPSGLGHLSRQVGLMYARMRATLAGSVSARSFFVRICLQAFGQLAAIRRGLRRTSGNFAGWAVDRVTTGCGADASIVSDRRHRDGRMRIDEPAVIS